MKKTLDELKEMLEVEMKKISRKGDISPADLENIEKAVCIIAKINTIEDGGYPMDGEMSHGMYYDNDMSYRRGRSMTTGRYMSRDYGPGRVRMEGSYERGYSGHSIKDRMIDRLEAMMDEAKSEYERNTVAEWIARLETSK